MNAFPHPKRPDVNPAPTVTINCRDYDGHRFQHVLDGHTWHCPACQSNQPTAETTTPQPDKGVQK